MADFIMLPVKLLSRSKFPLLSNFDIILIFIDEKFGVQGLCYLDLNPRPC